MLRMVLMLVTVAVAGGCGGGDAVDGTRRDVVAAFYPLAFAAERIAGEEAAVTNLTPTGAEPHAVELSARDVERVRSADVVLYLGGGFQPALERALDGAEGKGVDLLAAVDVLAGDAHDHGDVHEGEGADGDDALDPHVWLDPLRYAEIARRIGAELAAEERAASLAAELEELHREFQDGLADCARREIVTSHAAFAYLAARYDLEQVALTGLAPEAEPSARELEGVIERVRETGATTVFFETLVSPRLAETVARETGARTAVLNPLEGLTRDEGAAGADYFSVMRDNLEALREALGCR